MRIVLQRVKQAQVTVDDKQLGEIKKGYVLLVGVCDQDTVEDINYLAKKINQLRIFEDDNGKMNLDIHQVAGEILSISQFTLYANTKKGNRPSFVEAGQPDYAKKCYEQFNETLRQMGLKVATGKFGADMAVSLINDGPVTIVFDSHHR